MGKTRCKGKPFADIFKANRIKKNRKFAECVLFL